MVEYYCCCIIAILIIFVAVLYNVILRRPVANDDALFQLDESSQFDDDEDWLGTIYTSYRTWRAGNKRRFPSSLVGMRKLCNGKAGLKASALYWGQEANGY